MNGETMSGATALADALARLGDDYLEDALDGYVTCALWSSVHYADPEGNGDGVPLDDLADADDVSPDALAAMRADVERFIAGNVDDLERAAEMNLASDRARWTDGELAGHDLWLTRNGHGAGFWDRGYGDVGVRLSDAASALGESYLSYDGEAVHVD